MHPWLIVDTPRTDFLGDAREELGFLLWRDRRQVRPRMNPGRLGIPFQRHAGAVDPIGHELLITAEHLNRAKLTGQLLMGWRAFCRTIWQ